MLESENLYQRLILAALAKLEAEGTLPASATELAELANVGTDDARSVFASPEALHEGLLYQGVVLLNDALRQGVTTSGSVSPDDQLRSLARSYSDWAERNPGLFRLIVEGLNRPLPEDSTLYRFTVSMHDLFERKLNEMRNIGLMRPDTDLAAVLMAVHCVMKGASAVLVNRSHDPWLRDDPRSAAQLTTGIFEYFLDSLLVVHAPRAA